jgi:hypothetical protein
VHERHVPGVSSLHALASAHGTSVDIVPYMIALERHATMIICDTAKEVIGTCSRTHSILCARILHFFLNWSLGYLPRTPKRTDFPCDYTRNTAILRTPVAISAVMCCLNAAQMAARSGHGCVAPVSPRSHRCPHSQAGLPSATTRDSRR